MQDQQYLSAEAGCAPHEGAVTPDPLMACLRQVVKSSGAPFSEAAARANLPLAPREPLSTRLFPRAAAQCGYKADVIVRKPSEVPALVVPFVVPLTDGSALVVTSLDRSKGRAQTVLPSLSPAPRTMTLAALDAEAAGEVILLARDEALPDATTSVAGAGHWFWQPMARLWPSWLQVGFAALLINVLGLAVPIFVMNVYDRVLPNQSQPTLWALTTGVAIALTFEMLLRQLRASLVDQAGAQVEMVATARLFRQALSLPMSQRLQSPGALVSQIREFETVRDFFGSSSIVAFVDLLFIGIMVAVLYALVGPVATVVLGALGLVLLLTALLQWPLGRATRVTQAQATRRQIVLAESLGAIETVKAASAEGIMQRRFEEAITASVRASLWTRFWAALNINLLALVQQMVSVIVVVWGVFLAMEGQITVGGIIAASMLSGRALAPLSNIAMVMARAQAALASMSGLNDLMRRPAENDGRHLGNAPIDGSLAFEAVSFTYPEAPMPSLQDVSFKIAAGERVGLLGRIGSGKSTLLKLADGLWHPTSGTILVGGREVRSMEAADLRGAVALFGQDIELFTGTLLDNIVVGARDISEAAIAEACSISGVDDFASQNPMGLRMPVGERGRALSGGQRQAVALARTLLRKPRILILDEPSSALDNASEAELVRKLKAWVAENRVTLLVSSQRMALLELCDRLLVLEQGRLVADGGKSDVLRLLAGRSPPSTATGDPSRATR